MLDEPHTLLFELPEHRGQIERLKSSDPEFRDLAAAYDELDSRIQTIELAGTPVDDAHAEHLKKQRLLLKDRLFQWLIAEPALC